MQWTVLKRLFPVVVLTACGTPPPTPQPIDYHAQLDDLDLVGEHFGVELEEEPEVRTFVLEGLELLALWELEDAYWAEGTVGESHTARAYNKAAGAIDRMVWEPDHDTMYIHHPDDVVLVGHWAYGTRYLHPLNATLNLIAFLEGNAVAGDAAAAALDSDIFAEDDEAWTVLRVYAQRW